MAEKIFGAVDFGATSGRVIEVRLDGNNKLSFDVTHRFKDLSVQIFDVSHLCTDAMYAEALEGLSMLGHRHKEVASIGIDTWGVDYCLFDKFNFMTPSHLSARSSSWFRDYVGQLYEIVPPKELYFATGTQLMMNSIFRLFAVSRKYPEIFARAEYMLTLPGVFNFYLTGEKFADTSYVTTMQMYKADHSGWNFDLLAKVGLPAKLFLPVTRPGEVRVDLLPQVVERTGLRGTKLTSVASHDTGSAVTATPTLEKDFLFVSSGTVSIMGTEIIGTIVNQASYEQNMANEGGAFGTNKLLKNITGMFVLEELRREWQRRGIDADYGHLLAQARVAPPLSAFIDANSPEFTEIPGSMQEKIDAFLKKTGQPAPSAPGHYVRVVLESLAMKYRYIADIFREARGIDFSTLHVIGGGSRNNMMNQFAANAVNAEVIAGPEEATSIGNAMVQIAAEEGISSLSDLRSLLISSLPPQRFSPNPSERAAWEDAYGWFLANINWVHKNP